MFISIGIDENGKPFVTTSDKSEKPSRPNKGHSLIAAPDTYTVIDIETTGLDSRYCEIIELSALRYSNGSLVDSFTTLVKPTEPIDSFITELTGITNDLVADAPAISDAIKSFYDFVGSDILVGYNVNFDINFIYDVLQDTHSIDFTNSFVDVMRFARKLLPELKNHKLETVAAHYKVSSPAHRSYVDCEACNTCYQALLSDAISQYGDFDSFKASYSSRQLHAKDITATTDNFDISHPLYGKLCVFTGTLEKMQRKDAMQLVVNLGGQCGDNVTAKTNYLILGNNDFCSLIKDGKSNKQKKAESLILKGKDIQILSENVFYDLVLNQ